MEDAEELGTRPSEKLQAIYTEKRLRTSNLSSREPPDSSFRIKYRQFLKQL